MTISIKANFETFCYFSGYLKYSKIINDLRPEIYTKNHLLIYLINVVIEILSVLFVGNF